MSGALSWNNRVDAATFTTDSQATTLPASNLADPVVAKVWRTTGTTSAFVEINFGWDYEIGILVLAGCDFRVADTVRHRLSNVSAGAGELLDTGAVASGVVEGYGLTVHVLENAVTARHWRVDINAPSLNAQGFFSVGRAWAGDLFTPANNFSFGWEEQWHDRSTLGVAPRSGVEFIDATFQQRSVGFTFGVLTAVEALDNLREMGRLTGIRNQVLFIPDTAGSRIESEAIIGRMTKTTAIKYPAIPNVHSKTFVIRESK